VIIYPGDTEIKNNDLEDLGPPDNLGGTVLEGSPEISARFDYRENGKAAGVFEVTRGTVEIHFPFTEHATILEGKVKVTDEDGRSHTYKPGDSYFIKQNEIVIWEVPVERVRKSFFNIIE